jgi:Spy/CpxP family protein refolding chaperone
MRIVAGALFLTALFAVTSISPAQPQPPGGGQGGQRGKGDDKGGKDFPGRPGGGFGVAPSAPGIILPPFMADRLKLSDGQKKQVESLQKDVDEKLVKILTEEQNKQLKEMKERGRGGFGRPGGRPKGDDKGGNPPPPEE